MDVKIQHRVRALSPPRLPAGAPGQALDLDAIDSFDSCSILLWTVVLLFAFSFIWVYWPLALVVFVLLMLATCVYVPPQRVWSMGMQKYYGLSPYEIARERSLSVMRQLSNREVIETFQLYMDRHDLTFDEALRRWFMTSDDYLYFSSRRTPGQEQSDRLLAAGGGMALSV